MKGISTTIVIVATMALSNSLVTMPSAPQEENIFDWQDVPPVVTVPTA